MKRLLSFVQDIETSNNTWSSFSKTLFLVRRRINATNIRLIPGGQQRLALLSAVIRCIIITTGCLSCEAKGKCSYQMYAASQHLVRVVVWLFDFPRAERSGSEPYISTCEAQVLSFLKCCLSRVRYHTSCSFNPR